MDYQTLKSTLTSYLHRSDLEDMIPTFVTMAESRVNRDVKLIEMEVRATTTVSSGTNRIPLPDDFQELYNIQVNGDDGKTVMEQLSLVQMDVIYQDATTGTPIHYARTGLTLEIQPVPGEDVELEIIYRKRFDSLSEDSDTNDLLENDPSIYVYAAMLEASPFIQADERVPLWKEYYIAEVDGLNARAESQRFSGAPLQIRNLGMETP